VVVAVLTVFGLTHDLSRPGAIPIFLGYVSTSEPLLMGQLFHGNLLGMGIPSILRYPLRR
jgi:hypothetical protein